MLACSILNRDLYREPCMLTVFVLYVGMMPSPLLQSSRCANQIEEVCKDVEKTINQTVQNTLNSLERDCDQISQIVDEKLREDRYDCMFSLCSWLR